mmetsp:Transcript_16688/g.49918  ORF Transcript_16688/g.49918 Transcript_16688/m.49918 type:complete len:685 (-) Transcript_16688:57-2111(-)|eukprot:CAMPEP_0174232244 /NCGR_PEP_ID=MMETSP0417-20130205/2570_1 /TAXON_ID=242541 /ORGANISM="Mayorella sp, Strain BSH-02190019" /LENGTH=684 /DNA_ID=CAMNT_0015310255 /DNA_START=61 /DNA_END=2112 /DNA_ORIENTATION=+
MPIVDQENQSGFANVGTSDREDAVGGDAVHTVRKQKTQHRMMRSEAAMDGGVNVEEEAQRQKDIDYYAELTETYLDQGKNEEGLEAARRWSALEPRDADPRNFVAQFLCNLERWTEAIVELRLALKIKPDDVDNLDLLGTALTNQQQFSEAKEVYERLICLLEPGSTHSAIVFSNIGHVCMSTRQWENAVLAYQDAIKVDDYPQEEIADDLIQMGEAYANLNKHHQAIGVFKRALCLGADDAVIYNSIGISYEALGQTEKALVAYQKAVNMTPDFMVAYRNLAVAYKKQGQTQNAIKALRSVIAMNPNDEEVFELLGVLLMEEKNWSEAISVNHQLATLNENNLRAWNNIALASIELQQLDDASAACERAMKIDGEALVPLKNLAFVRMSQGRLTEAADYYKKLITLESENPHLYCNLYAGILFKQNDWQEAVRVYTQSIQLNPAQDSAYEELRSILHQKHALRMMIPICRKVAKLHPTQPIPHFYLGQALQYCGEAEEAESVLKDCTKLENGVAKYWYQLGSVQHELLKIQESEMALKRVILIDPLHKKAHWRLAAVLEDSGNFDAAEQELLIAKEIDPSLDVTEQLRILQKKNAAAARKNQQRSGDTARARRSRANSDADRHGPRSKDGSSGSMGIVVLLSVLTAASAGAAWVALKKPELLEKYFPSFSAITSSFSSSSPSQ